jgi:uncharacterized protein (TIGR03086 family)
MSFTKPFTKTANLPVSPDEAFALITQPERLRRWQTVSAYVDLRAGGEYRWNVTPGHYASGTFREVEPGKRVVFGWGWDGSSELPADSSTVTITIDAVEGGSQVTLVHEGLNEQQAAMHAEGWDHFFERLEKLVATGDAGQDEWAWAPENLDPIVAAEATLSVLQPVLRALTAEDRPKPTPCADFTCHELAVHLMESIAQLGAMAGASISMPTDTSLEDKVSTMAMEMIDAWRPIDLDGQLDNGLPASFGASIMPIELLLHAWDLAQASGQDVRVSDEVVAYVASLASTVVPGGRERGSFGPEVTAAADASPLDRLAAFAGRMPIEG